MTRLRESIIDLQASIVAGCEHANDTLPSSPAP